MISAIAYRRQTESMGGSNRNRRGSTSTSAMNGTTYLELADDNFRRPGADVRFFSLVACWTKWLRKSGNEGDVSSISTRQMD